MQLVQTPFSWQEVLNLNRTFLITALMTFVAIQSASANVVVSKTYTGAADFFDGSSGFRSVNFLQTDFDAVFAANTSIVDVDVTIFFAKHSGTTYVGPTAALPNPPFPDNNPFFSEMSFSLQKVGGPTVALVNANSFSVDVFGNPQVAYRGRILFDQSAATVVNAAPNTHRPPDSGVNNPVGYRPVGDLNAFNTLNGLGQWNLNVADNAADDGLSFYSFTVRVTAVPEPTSLGLLGMLVPCAFFRRRK